MKGYNRPLKPIEFVEEQILVGCLNCRNQWYELRNVLKNGVRVNGPLYQYDYCDLCKKDDSASADKALAEFEKES